MAFSSSSVIFRYICHGIVGRRLLSEALPLYFPFRMAYINLSSVHAPIPVAESEVRLEEKVTPQGPIHNVWSPVTARFLSCRSRLFTSGIGLPIYPARK